MKERKSIATFLEEYEAGKYVAEKFQSSSRDAQCEAGWYDWFCKDSELARRLKPMAAFLKKIADGGRFSQRDNYVFFKNNCPMVGKLYDSFSICSISTRDVIYWIGFLGEGCHSQPKHVSVSYVKGWSKDKHPEMIFKTSADAAKWFNGLDVEFEVKES